MKILLICFISLSGVFCSRTERLRLLQVEMMFLHGGGESEFRSRFDGAALGFTDVSLVSERS